MSGSLQCTRCGTAVREGALFCSRCGLDVTAVDADETVPVTPGGTPVDSGRSTIRQMLREATLGEYEILSELGRGGMATVFLAHDISLDRKVAIKVMAAHLLEGEGMAERFKLEARTAAQLSHPHIIPIYAVKETQSTLFFVMKYVEGRPLDEIIARTGPMPIEMVRDILTKVGAALGYAHRRGVVHRDVKPGNIMIDEEGTPIVTDFGIAKVAQKTGLTITGTTMGTPSYMSPEQCEAKEVTGASDQYALGVVAFQMLTGSLPFEADSPVAILYKHAHEPPPPLRDFRPDCPPEVLDTVTRMLAKDPADRWPTLEAVIQRLGTEGTPGLDAVRSQLVAAAEAGDLDRVRELSTPEGSMPGVGVVAAPPGGADRSTRRRAPVVAVAALLALAGAGTLAILQPWAADGTRPGDESTTAAGPDGAGGAQPEQGGSGVAEGDPGAGGPGGRDSGSDRTPEDDASTPVALVGAGEEEAVAPDRDPRTPAVEDPSPLAERPTVRTVRVEGVPVELEMGESVALSATAIDQAGRPIADSVVEACEIHGWSECGYRWASSDASVARIDAEGVVTASAPGEVELSVIVGGVPARRMLVVTEPSAATVSVQPPSLTLAVGDRRSVRATALDGRGRPLPAGGVGWTSSAPGVAEVTEAGEVVAQAPGRATVTAERDGARASVEVIVEAAPVDAATAVAELIALYQRALESRDLARVRAAYPGLTSTQAEQLEESLSYMDELRVDARVQSVEDRGDSATAVVAATYHFVVDGRAQQAQVSFTAIFQRVADGWRMTETRTR